MDFHGKQMDWETHYGKTSFENIISRWF